jgi:hypothetical protein
MFPASRKILQNCSFYPTDHDLISLTKKPSPYTNQHFLVPYMKTNDFRSLCFPIGQLIPSTYYPPAPSSIVTEGDETTRLPHKFSLLSVTENVNMIY